MLFQEKNSLLKKEYSEIKIKNLKNLTKNDKIKSNC